MKKGREIYNGDVFRQLTVIKNVGVRNDVVSRINYFLCKYCEESKTREEFYANKSCMLGLVLHCKVCIKNDIARKCKQKEWEVNNREKRKAQPSRSSDRLKENGRKSRACSGYREKKSAYHREWYIRNKDH
jgi:hypothetical protein